MFQHMPHVCIRTGMLEALHKVVIFPSPAPELGAQAVDCPELVSSDEQQASGELLLQRSM